MPRLLLALLFLSACSTTAAPSHSALGPEYREQLLMLDVSACEPEGAGIRCPLALEWQDYVTSFEVYGDHAGGPVSSTACLQVRELPTPSAPPYDWGPGGCSTPVVGAPAGVLWLQARLPDHGAGFSEDFAGSILVHLAPGDTLDGLIYYVQRLR